MSALLSFTAEAAGWFSLMPPGEHFQALSDHALPTSEGTPKSTLSSVPEGQGPTAERCAEPCGIHKAGSPSRAHAPCAAGAGPPPSRAPNLPEAPLLRVVPCGNALPARPSVL